MQLIFSVLAYVVAALAVSFLLSVISKRVGLFYLVIHATLAVFGLARQAFVVDCVMLMLAALCFGGLLCEADDDDDEFYKEHYE